ncbi:MAG: hypothetical protein M9949_14375 [Candidatus Kapabacteria bacterium]|nr:hypothetical protein [Candidatus Kapabacteria bacterium]
MMTNDNRRFNLLQLSKETKTTRKTLYEWIRKGYLQPTQIAGTRRKYSLEAFQIAEAKACKEALLTEEEKAELAKQPRKIPDIFFDRLMREGMRIYEMNKKNNALAVTN